MGTFGLTADPKTLARILRISAFGICAVAAAFLLFTGRFALGLPLAFVAAAFLRRWALPRLGPRLSQSPGRSPGSTSNVETVYLRLELAHDSGAMRGEILQVTYAGRELTELDHEQLMEVLAECQRHDGESAQLLEAYLDRSHGPEWRQQTDGDEQRQASVGPMTMEEAREVLGLDTNPSPSEIRTAHKRLMLKIPPAKGGSS